MSIRQSEARKCFRASKDYQLSEQAVAALALHLDRQGAEIAEQVLRRVDHENECRRIQGIRPRRRIEADDVARVIDDLGGPDGEMMRR